LGIAEYQVSAELARRPERVESQGEDGIEGTAAAERVLGHGEGRAGQRQSGRATRRRSVSWWTSLISVSVSRRTAAWPA
jgi:hypothetical protein